MLTLPKHCSLDFKQGIGLALNVQNLNQYKEAANDSKCSFTKGCTDFQSTVDLEQTQKRAAALKMPINRSSACVFEFSNPNLKYQQRCVIMAVLTCVSSVDF